MSEELIARPDEVVSNDKPDAIESAPEKTAEPVAPSEEKSEVASDEKQPEKATDDDNSVIRAMRKQIKRQSRELAELRQIQMQAMAQPDVRPTREQYPDESAYVQAEVAYQLRQAQAAPAQKPTDPLESTRETIRKQHPDFDEALQDIEHIRFRQASVEVFADAVENLEHGDELYYRLAKNPEMVEKFALLPPGAFAARLGELHAEIAREKNSKASVSKAPPPVTPEKSSTPPSRSYDEMSNEEFVRTRRKERMQHRMRFA
jgi:hypothetical protein